MTGNGGETEAAEPNTPDRDRLTQQATDELRRVEQVVSRITGLPSRWNGIIILLDEPGYRGVKSLQCDVRLDIARQTQQVRWRTHIHEMLHAHSAGLTRSTFDALPGWEEGVVERLQRLLRPRILEQIGVRVPEETFAQEDATHEYNPYVEALGSMYHILADPAESEEVFYITLLATPLPQV